MSDVTPGREVAASAPRKGLRLVEHQLVRPDATVLVSAVSPASDQVWWEPVHGFEPVGPRAYRRRELPDGEWIVRAFYDWPGELAGAAERPEGRLPSGVVLRGEPGQTAEEIAAPHVRAALTARLCPYHAEVLDDRGYCEVCRAHWQLTAAGWEFSADVQGLVERADMPGRAWS